MYRLQFRQLHLHMDGSNDLRAKPRIHIHEVQFIHIQHVYPKERNEEVNLPQLIDPTVLQTGLRKLQLQTEHVE